MKMRLSWADLVKTLKTKNAYEGDGSLDSVLEFVRENEIPVRDKTGREIDLAWLHKNKTVTISVAADAGEDVVMLGSKAADEDDEDGKSKMDDEDEDDGEKAATIQRLQKELDTAKRKMDLAGFSGSKTTSVDAKLFRNHGNRTAAHKAYNDRVAKFNAGVPMKQRPVFPDAETAEAFGAWSKNTLRHQLRLEPDNESQAIFKSYFGQKIQQGSVQVDGGALVPEEFDTYLVRLFEEYGLVRQLFRTVSMSRDVQSFPRQLDNVTVYYPGEAGSITASDVGFNQVKLAAVKQAALTRMSSEIIEDSALNIADAVAWSMGYAMTKKDDDDAWLGDGTSTYGGTTGVHAALQDVDGAGTDSAGLVVGASNTDTDWTNFTLADFNEVIGNLPEYPSPGGPVWVMHKKFYHNVWRAIALAAGGVTRAELEQTPQTGPMLLGFPVRFHQSLASASNPGTNVVVATLGYWDLGATIGDRRQMTIATSADRYFDSDEIAMRVTQRRDIKVHDVGDSSNAGPIVGLVTSAS